MVLRESVRQYLIGLWLMLSDGAVVATAIGHGATMVDRPLTPQTMGQHSTNRPQIITWPRTRRRMQLCMRAQPCLHALPQEGTQPQWGRHRRKFGEAGAVIDGRTSWLSAAAGGHPAPCQPALSSTP